MSCYTKKKLKQYANYNPYNKKHSFTQSSLKQCMSHERKYKIPFIAWKTSSFTPASAANL